MAILCGCRWHTSIIRRESTGEENAGLQSSRYENEGAYLSGKMGEKRLLIIVNADLRYVLRREIKVRGLTPERIGWAVT